MPVPNEPIVVNDGSTDDTLERVNRYYVWETRVRVISIPNGGGRTGAGMTALPWQWARLFPFVILLVNLKRQG